MIDHLSSDFDFKIITSDRDLGDNQSYDSVEIDQWNNMGGVDVFYASPKSLKFTSIVKVINETDYDVLYLNSFFQPKFSIIPLLARSLGKLKNKNLLITPRGELEPGCLEIKPIKKKVFIQLGKFIKLFKNSKWHATTQQEKIWIQKVLNVNPEQISVASNLTHANPKKEPLNFHIKNNPFKICFISRITREKNLDYALRIIDQVKKPVIFNIYGTNDQDKNYWMKCNNLIQSANKDHEINYNGELHPSTVADTFKDHDLFLFPTHGENFAHVIYESIAAGTPVLITDTTPWRDLSDKGAGWDIPIDDMQSFVDKIEWLCDLQQKEYQKLRENTFSYAISVGDNPKAVSATRNMFQNCINNY